MKNFCWNSKYSLSCIGLYFATESVFQLIKFLDKARSINIPVPFHYSKLSSKLLHLHFCQPLFGIAVVWIWWSGSRHLVCVILISVLLKNMCESHMIGWVKNFCQSKENLNSLVKAMKHCSLLNWTKQCVFGLFMFFSN